MRRLESTTLAASAVAGLCAWISIGSLAVATHDTGSRFGFLPPLWLIPVLMVAFAFCAWAVRLSASASLPLFFSLVLVLPWIPGRVPAAFLVWTGPVVIAVWVVVALAVVLVRKREEGIPPIVPARLTKGPYPFLAPAALAFAAYLAGGWWLSRILPGGDEPHYLVITQSLLRDGDIRIENNYARQDYLEFWAGPLRPHYLQRGVNGEIYSIHAPGLPVLMAPAFALSGHPGVVVFLALLAAAGSALLWRASYLLTHNAGAAWFAWAAGALTAPFYFESFAAYPDGVGATLVLFAVLPLFEETVSRKKWIAIGGVLALLPWLHTRFAIISAALGLILVVRLLATTIGRARIPSLLALPIVSAIGWFGFFRVVYGRFDPSSPYGEDTQTSAANILNGFPALLFDQQFGVLPNAPIYAFCFAGLIALARRRPRIAVELTLIALPYMLAVSAFHMWWAGSSAPARFFAPVLPVLAIPAAWLWHVAQRRSTRAIGVAGLLISLMTTVLLAVPDGGVLAYNVRDGYARAATWINPLVDMSRGLPSFFRQAAGGAVLRAAVWIGFAAAAAACLRLIDTRVRSLTAFAVVTPAVFAMAVMGALTVVWRLEAVAATNPQASQLHLLGAYDTRIRPIGITLSPALIESASTLLRTITITSPESLGAPRPGTLLLVPAVVPGGEYELRKGGGAPSAGTARLVIGRLARENRTWSLASDFHDGGARLDLPVTVGSLIIAGEPDSRPGTLTLHPTHVFEGRSRITRDIARRVERLGGAIVFFFDLNTYPESAGFWVRGGRAAQVAVPRPQDGTPLNMLIRNAASANTVTFDIDDVSRSFSLLPGEERTVPIPFGDGRPGALIKIQTLSGFRPSEVEPGSADTRFLGAWIEFR
jgi:hypothetical protein